MKYVEVVCVVDVDRSTQCGRPLRCRTRELNQLCCPVRLAVLEAHDAGFIPTNVNTLTLLARGLVDAEL